MATFLNFGSEINTTGEIFNYTGGRAAVTCQADNFASTTFNLQMSMDETTWLAIKDINATAVTFTSNGMFNINIPGCKLRMRVTGGNPNDVTNPLCKISRTSGGGF